MSNCKCAIRLDHHQRIQFLKSTIEGVLQWTTELKGWQKLTSHWPWCT